MKDRFWSCVQKRKNPIACWEWLGPKGQNGYGRFSIQPGSRVGAHRVAFFLTHGYWPNICRHTCDNKGCVNPRHLLDGTIADNTRDRDVRGRVAKGIAHGQSKLSESEVRRIRRIYASKEENGASIRSLAKEFGAGYTTIRRLLSGQTWKHI